MPTLDLPPEGAEGNAKAADLAATEPEEEKQPDLGPPLVEDVKSLKQLDPHFPVFVDKAKRSVVMVGVVCQNATPLELFACLRGSKDHESVVAVATKAYVVHAGLLAVGAEPGNPVIFHPEYVPAKGPVIDVTVIWKDAQGQIRKAAAQQWVRDARTKKAMEAVWVFGGSKFEKDEESGREFYRADMDGELICVSNFPSAMLDLPIKSTDANADLLYECFTENIPPRGTPVTLVLTPKEESK